MIMIIMIVFMMVIIMILMMIRIVIELFVSDMQQGHICSTLVELQGFWMVAATNFKLVIAAKKQIMINKTMKDNFIEHGIRRCD